ncbi:MAG: hypothetical protein F4X92_07140 [Gammaproteobacteria bacterium]|nr:hypothetical protein [Gammaproteobacteria bacterium]
MPRVTEPTFNVELSNLLRRKHPHWSDRVSSEQTNIFEEAAGLKPDIIVLHPGGIPVAIETEFAPAHTVEADAMDRLGKTLKQNGDNIEQALAVRIPKDIVDVNQGDLQTEIEKATLEYCILSGDAGNPERWPVSGWLKGSIDDLADCVELAAFSEKRAVRGMTILENRIHQAAEKLREACEDAPDTLDSIAGSLHQKGGIQTYRMAMAILANALTFHIAIAGTHGIETPDQLRGELGGMSKTRVLQAWEHILAEINYWPIFNIASDILLPIRDDTAQVILDRLVTAATELVSLGATSQHDLCGRMFQRLISDRKFLATFYTLPSSSALLAELAIHYMDVDWSDKDTITSLRVGDFACGTGALLNAAYENILSRYRRKGGDDRSIHPKMIENSIVGSDILPSATHLTASVLSSSHPSVTFGNTSIVTLPYGNPPQESGRKTALGAIDLIEDERTYSLFGTGRERIRGSQVIGEKEFDMHHDSFDLVIMNPPFTRPTGQEAEKIGIPMPSFAGFATSEDEQRLMSARLREIKKPEMVGNGNAGLASNFIDLAHAKCKRSGGVLALVLPAAFLQGESWASARGLFVKHYQDLVVVTIATDGQTARAFSADTGMAETLIIGTRRDKNADTSGSTLFVNLERRPKTILEAKTVARSVCSIKAQSTDSILNLGTEQKGGIYIRGTLTEAGPAGVRSIGVARASLGLVQGKLHLPRKHEPVPLPLVRLGDLGDRGLYHMDISGKEINVSTGLPRGPFDIVPLNGTPTWPVLWSHKAARETKLTVMPDRRGCVRPECQGRASEVWKQTASHLHFNRDFQINSQPLAACITPDLSIGGTAWPNYLCADSVWEKPLVLWANTTLGLIAFWWIGTRQQEGRARLSITKLPSLMVLDPRCLTPGKMEQCHGIFEEFHDREMLPANEAWRDEARQELDYAMMIKLLGLPEETMDGVNLLRMQWCEEPSVHGGKSTAPNLS